jgi:malonyl-CoA/methylmalonyl-CoA synthetase
MHPLLPALDRDPSRLALHIGDRRVTYGELARMARAHAGALAIDRIPRGGRVAVWATPHVETIAALTGNALAGVASVPINPSIGERELAHVLADAAPARILAAEPERFVSRTPGVRPILFEGPIVDPQPPTHHDTLLVLYTSGTTGPPKGAVITHRNAAFDLDGLADAWGWTAEDTLVHGLPLFHVHGLVLGVFGPLRVGSALRLLPRFSPEAVCAAMTEGCSLMFGVPTMYHRLVDHAEADPRSAAALAKARLLVSGSAPLPIRDNERLFRLCGQRVVERYGLTETLILCAARHDGPRTAGVVGPPLPGIELRLVDDARQPIECVPDAIGEIAIRGPCVFAGYLNRPEATAQAMDADGFFYTGDIGTLTPAGEVRIVGRKATDLIKTAGYKVGAGEVEAALLEHPAIREAAVVGMPDDDLGERIVAFVVAREGTSPAAQELVDHVAGLLAPHKRPREVHLLEALPRNDMGKVLKKQLARKTS